MHSILGRGSFCTNYCINAAWHEGNQRGTVMEAQVAWIATFSSSVFFGLITLMFLLTIPRRQSMGFRSG